MPSGSRFNPLNGYQTDSLNAAAPVDTKSDAPDVNLLLCLSTTFDTRLSFPTGPVLTSNSVFYHDIYDRSRPHTVSQSVFESPTHSRLLLPVHDRSILLVSIAGYVYKSMRLLGQGGVHAVGEGEELLVRALLEDAAVPDAHDAVCVLDRGQAVVWEGREDQ